MTKAISVETVAERIERWTAISSLALVAVTWRLWTPQDIFPQVPALSWLCQTPAWIDWILLGGLVFGLTSLTLDGVFSKTTPANILRQCARCVVILSLTGFFLLDQHRFQPWAYMLWLTMMILFTCSTGHRLLFLRWLVISIYFYSALGKFDFEFLHTVGQQMLGTILKWLGIAPAEVSMPLRLGLVVVFPIVELLLAVGLIQTSARRVTAVCAILFHIGLILVLGPLGMNHRPGVLVWNIQIALQVYWLFVANSSIQEATSETAQMNYLRFKAIGWSERISLAMVAMVLIMPLFERIGLWDHWPSWALYAPHSSRVQIEINAPAVDKLPSDLAKLTTQFNSRDDEAIAVWMTVPIDAWSLSALDTPIYPQSRFQLGVARDVLKLIAPEYQAKILMLGSAGRLSGKREIQSIENEEQIDSTANQFWFNTKPRELPQHR